MTIDDIIGKGYVDWKSQKDEMIISAPHDLSRSLLSLIRHRRQDEVERVGNLDCRLTTSMKTQYNGQTTVKGTMFTLIVKERLELLSMEFDVNGDITGDEDLSVQVYYKEGDFSGATNDKEKWTQLADTVFFLAPDGKGAIIPANDFTKLDVEPQQMYSIYLTFQTDAIKIKSSNRLIGEKSKSSDVLDLYVGVALDDGPFPSSLGRASDFSGVFNYRTLLPCPRALMETSVKMLFAINKNPEAETMIELADAVEGAITALSILDPTLIRYQKFHELVLEDVAFGFMGRSGKFSHLLILFLSIFISSY